MHDHISLTRAAILLAGISAQWLAWWLRLPAILPLLAVGLLAGPATGWLDPDRLFGHLLFPMVSLGVAVILFEGALTLRFAEIHGQARVVRNLVSFQMRQRVGNAGPFVSIESPNNRFHGVAFRFASLEP